MSETENAPEVVDGFLTVGDVAERLQLHKSTVWKMIHNGRLKAFKVGGNGRSRWRIPASELAKLEESGGD